MTIAGSDSGGGAGIQADLKAFAAAGAHGMSAIVALTAQNTIGVTAVHELPPDFVVAQLEAVFADIGVDAAKTGMLFSRRIVDTVASFLREHPVPLSGPALALLRSCHPPQDGQDRSSYVFPGERLKKPLSEMALEMLVRRMNEERARVFIFQQGLWRQEVLLGVAGGTVEGAGVTRARNPGRLQSSFFLPGVRRPERVDFGLFASVPACCKSNV